MTSLSNFKLKTVTFKFEQAFQVPSRPSHAPSLPVSDRRSRRQSRFVAVRKRIRDSDTSIELETDTVTVTRTPASTGNLGPSRNDRRGVCGGSPSLNLRRRRAAASTATGGGGRSESVSTE